jgi:hypothetical protein
MKGVLYNILIQFGVPMVPMITMHLKETNIKVCTCLMSFLYKMV